MTVVYQACAHLTHVSVVGVTLLRLVGTLPALIPRLPPVLVDKVAGLHAHANVHAQAKATCFIYVFLSPMLRLHESLMKVFPKIFSKLVPKISSSLRPKTIHLLGITGSQIFHNTLESINPSLEPVCSCQLVVVVITEVAGR